MEVKDVLLLAGSTIGIIIAFLSLRPKWAEWKQSKFWNSPIQVDIIFDYQAQEQMPFVVVNITNQTTNTPVFIQATRIHFGSENHSRSLRLEPYGEIKLEPKSKTSWRLEYSRNIVSVHYRTKTPPQAEVDPEGPGIESPAQLFNAIGHGAPKDSWISVDFNEHQGRVFQRGKVQMIFDQVGKKMKQLREQSQAS